MALALAVVLALTWPALYAAAAANLGAMSVVRLVRCPDVTGCQSSGATIDPRLEWANDVTELDPQLAGELGRRSHQLDRALGYAPWADSARYRLAEIQFALGHRDAAARLLPPVELRLPDMQAGPASHQRSRLMNPGRYESYLVGAYQQVAAGNWAAAVVAFRLALSVGAESLTPADHAAFFDALARYYAERSRQDAVPARSIYLAGKYFARAGQWAEAEGWLERAPDAAGWSEMTAVEQARTWMYLGMVNEQASRLDAARVAYETALTVAPALAEPQARLLALLRRLGDQPAADISAATLAEHGPTYRLGQFGEGYETPQPVTLSDGWTLVGYDLDEESLEAGGVIELWLWWQAPAREQPANSDWLRVGDFWLQNASVVNLAPNPGFEWGMAANGLPLGFFVEYHTSTPQAAAIVDGQGPNKTSTSILTIPDAGITGVKSFPLEVDAQGLYLTTAWLKREGARAAVGRQCFPADYRSDYLINLWAIPRHLVWYVAELQDDSPRSLWVHAAHVGVPLADPPPAICQLFLEQQSGSAEFDQVLFAKLPIEAHVGQ